MRRKLGRTVGGKIPGNISALIDTKGSGVVSINGVGLKWQKHS